MSNEIIGSIRCPHCGNAATVHKQRKAGAKLYYRCYRGAGSLEAVCGTVQITGPIGQAWIKENMRSLEPVQPIAEKREISPIAEKEETPAAPPEAKEPRSGWLSNFWKEENEA